MKYRLTLILALSASVLLCSCGDGSQDEDAPVQNGPSLNAYGLDASLKEVSGEIASGETLPGILMRFGADNSTAFALVDKCKGILDVRRIQCGKSVKAFYDADSTLAYFVYVRDKVNSTIFQCKDSLAVWNHEKAVELQQKTVDVTITSSLWNDLISAGASPLLIVELSEIYAWTVNFFGLQAGDRFRAVYTQKVCDDEVVAIDAVHYSIYDSGNFHARAVRFDQRDGGGKYWNEKGESMRKAFLKAPLKYNRISSRFTYHRRHPVTGKVRPHTGVDYAAPKGTPVHSIGDGTVTLCGWDPSGGGNRIRIRHMNGYETCYMHLSGFAKGVRTGSRVAQGQVIGYVGSTGRSTGPHLDFRVWKDKTPIDPLKMISPPAQPLDRSNMDSLAVLVAKYDAILNQKN